MKILRPCLGAIFQRIFVILSIDGKLILGSRSVMMRRRMNILFSLKKSTSERADLHSLLVSDDLIIGLFITSSLASFIL